MPSLRNKIIQKVSFMDIKLIHFLSLYRYQYMFWKCDTKKLFAFSTENRSIELIFTKLIRHFHLAFSLQQNKSYLFVRLVKEVV